MSVTLKASQLTDLAEASEAINSHMCWQDCDKLTNGTGECNDCVLRQAVDRLGAIIDEVLATVRP